MRSSAKLTLLLICLFPLLAGTAHGEGRAGFVIIQPGQPGTTRDAQPVMDSLAAYLKEKTGSVTAASGHYFNDLHKAMAFLKNSPPRWGIVSLGFYLENASRLSLTPIASTRPGGMAKETWTLVTRKEGPDKWKLLKGTVRGTMLFEKTSASCILFGLKPAGLPFELAGTSQPLRALRATLRGHEAGVVLDNLQYQALQSLPMAEGLKTVLTTELPSDPVVWFGTPDEASKKLEATLVGMGKDSAAADLLKVLQTDGFTPPDPALANIRKKVDENCGP